MGPTGQTLASNLRRIRGRLPLRDLSQLLAEAGRPIPASTLQKIEAGVRRVDVDDLVALAVVLGVSPLTLLLPADGTASISSDLTAAGSVAHDRQWLWALGREPLTEPASEGERARYRLDSVPYIGRDLEAQNWWGDVLADTQARILSQDPDPEHRVKTWEESAGQHTAKDAANYPADEEVRHGDD